jgi:hypothetical protein
LSTTASTAQQRAVPDDRDAAPAERHDHGAGVEQPANGAMLDDLQRLRRRHHASEPVRRHLLHRPARGRALAAIAGG